MPRNPTTGVFTRVSNTFSEPVTGTVIDETDAIATFNDYDSGVTQSVAIGAIQTIAAGDQTQIQTNIGGTTVGIALFTAVDATAGRTALALGTAAVRADTDFPRTDVLQLLSSGQKDQARVNASAFGVVRVQKITSSGTYTPNANMVCGIGEVWGGGGAGGGVAGVAGWQGGGAGGGAGGYARKYFTKADIGASQSVTIGAAGAPGSAGNNPGGNGGTTSLGSLCSAGGGAGGSGNTRFAGFGYPGAGGSGGSGDIVGSGQGGGAGGSAYTGASSFGLPSGQGGSTFLGQGGPATLLVGSGNGDGGGAVGYGAGGGGAYSTDNAANSAGGAGTAGIVVITEFCTK